MRKFLLLMMMVGTVAIAIFPVMAQDDTISDIVGDFAGDDDDSELIVLLNLIVQSDRLSDMLSDSDASLTVFAPTDEAFTAFLDLAEITLEELLAQPEVIEAILLYHVVEDTMPVESLTDMDGDEVPTLLGDFAPITIEITDDNEIAMIDGIDFAEFGLLDEDPNATIITPDIEAVNGVVHIIDHVLLPSDAMLQQHFDMQSMDSMDAMNNTIADVMVASAASDDPEFSILLAAISAADESIAAMLSDPEADYTVFAPTDEAFAILLADMGIDAETLLADTDLLNDVLRYHVLEGAVMAEAILTLDGETVPTQLGEDATIDISVTDEAVVLNGTINVLQTDIEADNGVIHVIDGVLIPASDQ